MPLVTTQAYRPDLLYRSAHAATTLPTLLRRIDAVPAVRERLTTSDGDFIDLDCWWQNAPPGGHAPSATVVLCHGLEGNTSRQYMLGMARAFGNRGWNVAGYNYRSCSGEPNRKPYSYHSGATGDLHEVLTHLDRSGRSVRALVGFSLGGNLILKYLGEDPAAVLPSIGAAVAFSVPVLLADTAVQLEKRSNWAYSRRFLRKLSAKVRQKAQLFPEQVNASLLDQVKTLRDFDEVYTAPLSGFTGADDYYQKCSCRQFLPAIQVRSLLVSAQDDPFLGSACYPREEAEASKYFHLEMPRYGGHVGFRLAGGEYWSEQRAVAFITENLS